MGDTWQWPVFRIEIDATMTHVFRFPDGIGGVDRDKLKEEIMSSVRDEFLAEIEASREEQTRRFDAAIAHVNETTETMKTDIADLERRVAEGNVSPEALAAFRKYAEEMSTRINVLNPENQATLRDLQATLARIDEKGQASAKATKSTKKGSAGRKD